MRTQDTIADLLTCLRNAQMAGLRFFYVPHSKVKESILNVLFQNGYILGFFILDNNSIKKSLVIFSKFYNFTPVIKNLMRLSKPSVRVYFGVSKLSFLARKLGIIIFSSTFGTISSSDASLLHCGGEVLCSVE